MLIKTGRSKKESAVVTTITRPRNSANLLEFGWRRTTASNMPWQTNALKKTSIQKLQQWPRSLKALFQCI